MADDVKQRLAKRNEERLQTIEKRKLESGQKTDPEESKDMFLSTFSKEHGELEDLLKNIDIIGENKIADHFEKLSTKCQQLQKFLADSSMFLPSYNIKASQDRLNALQQTITEERERRMPKKKFAFRSRKKEIEAVVTDGKSQDVPDGKELLKTVDTKQASSGFKQCKSQELSMDEKETFQQDIVLSDLEDCTVRLLGPASTLHMDRLINCTILSAPIATSIFIDGCTDCTFILGCQQLRVHKTTSSQFYLHVTSRAIIEDCTKVGFAPYLMEYDGKLEHFKMAGLGHTVQQNNWSLVNDFNWLRRDEHSPNWFIIPEENRMKWTLK